MNHVHGKLHHSMMQTFRNTTSEEAKRLPAEIAERVRGSASEVSLAYRLISLSAPEKIVCKQNVLDLVNTTIVESLPKQMPSFLHGNKSFVIEPNEGQYLFDDCPAIAAAIHDIDGEYHIVVYGEKGSLINSYAEAVVFNGTWERITECFNAGKWLWFNRNISFITTLALLLEAEGSPLVQSEPQNYSPLPRKKGEPAQSTIRYIKLSNRPNVIIEDRTPRPETVEPLDKTGMIAEKVHVRGHLKMQACGPKNSERKLIYVAPYTSTAWRNINRETRISA